MSAGRKICPTCGTAYTYAEPCDQPTMTERVAEIRGLQAQQRVIAARIAVLEGDSPLPITGGQDG